jgi:hypothetical protein
MTSKRIGYAILGGAVGDAITIAFHPRPIVGLIAIPVLLIVGLILANWSSWSSRKRRR